MASGRGNVDSESHWKAGMSDERIRSSRSGYRDGHTNGYKNGVNGKTNGKSEQVMLNSAMNFLIYSSLNHH